MTYIFRVIVFNKCWRNDYLYIGGEEFWLFFDEGLGESFYILFFYVFIGVFEMKLISVPEKVYQIECSLSIRKLNDILGVSNIIEYNVTKVIVGIDGGIEQIYAKRPQHSTVFFKNEINKEVFFSYEEAKGALL